MKISFVNQVALGTVCMALIGWLIAGEKGLPLFLGSIWGAANLLLIKQLTQQLFLAEQKNYFKIILLVLLKCPLLYFSGYLLLKTHMQSIIYLLIGFSLSFTSMLLIGIKEHLKEQASSSQNERS